MKRHVLILGAGFGGLELATRRSETAPDAVDVTLLDRNDTWPSSVPVAGHDGSDPEG
jgi:sulfide:quinone oxidoreductase